MSVAVDRTEVPQYMQKWSPSDAEHDQNCTGHKFYILPMTTIKGRPTSTFKRIYFGLLRSLMPLYEVWCRCTWSCHVQLILSSCRKTYGGELSVLNRVIVVEPFQECFWISRWEVPVKKSLTIKICIIILTSRSSLFHFAINKCLLKTILNLTISSGKQLIMVLMYSCRAESCSAFIFCTFFSPPLVTNNLRALLSWGRICRTWNQQDWFPHTARHINNKCYVFRAKCGIDLAELADNVFENIAGSFGEECLQSWKVSALLKDAL